MNLQIPQVVPVKNLALYFRACYTHRSYAHLIFGECYIYICGSYVWFALVFTVI